MSRFKWVNRKCRSGEVWKYQSGGLAAVLYVRHIEVAPECEVFLLDNNGEFKAKDEEGRPIPIGIMERELTEKVGTWSPAIDVKEQP